MHFTAYGSKSLLLKLDTDIFTVTHDLKNYVWDIDREQ
jgi:hypothetical protein